MKTKVIDIRKLKQDPEKVVAYWVSQGGKETNRPDDIENFPYCGIDTDKRINYWTFIAGDRVLIDLPESQDDSEEEFKTGDRVVDSVGSKGYFIGTLNGTHYYIADDIQYVCSTQTTTLKHYKEPELFEGWVSQFCNVVFESWAQAHEACSDARVFKVREVKDED
jgi:hypothetical protein